VSSRPPASADAQDDINGSLYSRADLVGLYATPTLYPPEATALVRFREDIVGRRVLDLGCGAGRLATYLRPLTGQYVGLDISPHMLEHCRRNFPGLQFLECDMRQLTPLPDESIDTAFAICNLFDAVSDSDRLRILAEVRRVLVPEGLLVFSAHNRNSADLARGPRLAFSRNPFTQLRYIVDFFQARANHRRIKPHERLEPDYALLNDSGHNYAVLHYYISKESQAKQLAGAGFRLLECLDESGCTLGPGEDDRACSSIHYVARRLA
jgi:SAM-dependent methyltransferase